MLLPLFHWKLGIQINLSQNFVMDYDNLTHKYETIPTYIIPNSSSIFPYIAQYCVDKKKDCTKISTIKILPKTPIALSEYNDESHLSSFENISICICDLYIFVPIVLKINKWMIMTDYIIYIYLSLKVSLRLIEIIVYRCTYCQTLINVNRW